MTPLHDLREISGSIEKLLSPEVYLAADRNDYLHITLTDEEDLVDPLVSLRIPTLISLPWTSTIHAMQQRIVKPISLISIIKAP